ncbi:CooT family nickel-binding protein [Desulfobulbus sp. N3]|nr:CooT family nickel-binding protein [Desulfobulbus sp. N3]
MCQLNVVMEREGKQETLMEAITGLEVTEQGVVLRTYFDASTTEPPIKSMLLIEALSIVMGSSK